MKKIDIKVSQIIDFLNEEIIRVDGFGYNEYIDNISDPESVNSKSLDWVNSTKTNKQEIVELSPAKVFVVDSEVKYSESLSSRKKTLIVVQNPRFVISKIASHFFIDTYKSGIHPSAIVDNEAIVDPTAYIGPGCIVGKALIGANTVLVANVTIYNNVKIGDRCLIQAGTVIGTDGLGCSRDENGVLSKFPHLGGVVMGNDIEVGANSQIARGSFSDTIIEDGCKLNGLCFIAHNCHLEKNVWITGNTMLCGSVRVGKNSTIFSSVTIRDQRKIGESVTIGMGSVVTKDVPAYEIWVGNPAKKMNK